MMANHAERQRLYEICATRGATPILVVCTCAEFAEVRRRFRAREGHEADPEREASDLSVFRDIRRRWENPFQDQLPGGAPPAILIYDMLNGGTVRIRRGDAAPPSLVAGGREALEKLARLVEDR